MALPEKTYPCYPDVLRHLYEVQAGQKHSQAQLCTTKPASYPSIELFEQTRGYWVAPLSLPTTVKQAADMSVLRSLQDRGFKFLRWTVRMHGTGVLVNPYLREFYLAQKSNNFADTRE